MGDIDVSTHVLAEKTCQALKGKVSLEDVLTIWHSIGKVVKEQMITKKGVRLPSLGTFSYTDRGEPVFSMANELGKQFSICQHVYGHPSSGTPTNMINLSQVREGTKIPRDIADKIYAKFMACLGRCLSEGRSVVVTIHRVAEITIGNGRLECEFVPQFIDRLQSIQNSHLKTGKQRATIRKTAERTALALSIDSGGGRTSCHRNSSNIFAEGSELAAERPKKKTASRPGNWDRNPITGAGDDDYDNDDGLYPRGVRRSGTRVGAGAARPRPASAGRARIGDGAHGNGRPMSAGSHGTMSTSSLMYSPASGARAQSRGRGGHAATTSAGPGGARGGLTRAQLERFNRTQNDVGAPGRRPASAASGGARGVRGATDPRVLAAKALDVGDVVEKVRKKIIERGGSSGIRGIAKLLSIMDDNGDKRLSKDEFKYGMRDYGIDLSPTELEQVFMYFDRDGNGFIDCTEFLVGLRGEMPGNRKKFVRMAFDILDKDGSGVIEPEEILGIYDFTWHPTVREGKKTVKEAAKEFMAQWDRKDKDGLITYEEFEDYYKEVSASIDDDTYFELMMRNAWRISGGTGAAANTANRRVLVTNRDGTQSVQTVNNELGMRAGDKDDIRRRLSEQGIDAQDIALYGGVDSKAKTSKAQLTGAMSQRLGRPGNKNSTAPAPRGRASSAGRARGVPTNAASAPRPRDAWGPSNGPVGALGDDFSFTGSAGGGDMTLPLSRPESNGGYEGGGRGGSAGTAGAFDPFVELKRLLYTPPVPLEPFCAKLAVSSVTSAPRVAMGAFQKRMVALDPSFTRAQLKVLWDAIDPHRQGVVEVTELHNLLAEKFGKDKTSAKGAGVVERVIKKILERCGQQAGIKGLQRTLAIMDDNGDKRLTREELKTGLADYGVDLNLREMDEIFNYFDRDRNGVLDVSEFLIGVKGEMSDRRKALVQQAFNILDTDRSGYITVDEMLEKYDFSFHPEVKTGKKTVQQAMREFMCQWDDKDGDGTVSYDEFEDYYKGLSASIDGDDYFELMMRNAWRIPGGTGAAANTANRRVLVTNRDGTQSVQTVNNELGMRAGDKDDIRRRLSEQGIDAQDIALYGGVDSKAKTSKAQLTRNVAAKLSGPRGMNSTAPAHAPLHQRHNAAAKLAAAYRGRQGRKEVEQKKRYLDAERRAHYEEAEEAARPKARQIARPKGNSYIGF